MSPHVAVDRVQLAAFCERNGIRRLAVFGSALRDDFTPDIPELVAQLPNSFSRTTDRLAPD